MAVAQNTAIKRLVVVSSAVALFLYLLVTAYHNNNDFKDMDIEVDKIAGAIDEEIAKLNQEHQDIPAQIVEDVLSEDHVDDVEDPNDCLRRDILLGPALQNDSCILDIIRTKFLVPPSKEPYNIQPRSEANFSAVDILKKETIEQYIDTKNPNGFFIECGANDGEFLSNTLQVELDYKWTGLLVEANGDAYSKLKTKNRKSWLINACLSPVPYASQFTFYTNPKNSGVSGLNFRKKWGAVVGTVTQCFPIYSILAAINVTTVDYFSLDIEGKELEILQTIPFDMVTFKLLSVEHWSVPGGREAVQAFLETKGYTFIREMNDRWTHDGIYVHNSLVTSEET